MVKALLLAYVAVGLFWASYAEVCVRHLISENTVGIALEAAEKQTLVNGERLCEHRRARVRQWARVGIVLMFVWIVALDAVAWPYFVGRRVRAALRPPQG